MVPAHPSEHRRSIRFGLTFRLCHSGSVVRGDVIARAPVFFTRDAIEVLLDDLLTSRESVASARKRLWQIGQVTRAPVGAEEGRARGM